MISNICKIEKGINDLEAILKESERVAHYNGFTPKQTLHLRLICEEVDGMLPNIVDNFSGDFWIEFEDGVCKVNVTIDIPELDKNKKEQLIDVAKNKKNAAAVGIVGKIRNVIENYFLNRNDAEFYVASPELYHLSAGACDGMEYAYCWTLNQYKVSVKEAAREEEWDELEKSIIAALADDVIVGVKGKQANIVIIKKIK